MPGLRWQRTEADLADAVRRVSQTFQARDQERANLAVKRARA